jgi:TDG/mug DNA glycosylase family protein
LIRPYHLELTAATAQYTPRRPDLEPIAAIAADCMMTDILPDLLAPGLRLVFCGSAPSVASAEARAYYAFRGNKFWPTLHAVGLTPRRLAPQDFPELLRYGIGLTDVTKTEFGNDSDLRSAAPERVRRAIATYRPAALAFNGKRPAKLVLGTDRLAYGRQPEPLGDTVVFVLPSTSGRAGSFWSLDPWHDLAVFVNTISPIATTHIQKRLS